VKAERADAYLIGENWFDGTAQLQGNMWDAVMNYAGFTHPLWYWLSYFYIRQHAEPYFVASDASWSTTALLNTWQTYRAAVPWALACQQFNLLASHDTARLHNVVDGDLARNRLAVALLLTYPGVPSIYYGDEIGLCGDSRECMNWDRSTWNHDLRAYYQTLIHLRQTSPALIDGGFQVVMMDEDAFAFVRDSVDETILVVANRQPRSAAPLPIAHAAIADNTEFTELFSGERLRVTNGHLPLPSLPVGASIWRTKN
jgi:alpha-glucosidase